MRVFLQLFIFILSSSLCGATAFSDSTKISSVVETYLAQSGFSGTILVAKDGKPIYHQSYGLANHASPDTIKNDYHYGIASMTKLFTSIRVLQLQEEQKIDLHQPLVQYLPQFKGVIAEAVSVHHLLLHISGLPNEKDEVYRQRLSTLELVEQVLQKNKFGVVGKFNYNNLDYLLLGLLIEQITGASWQQNVTEHIIRPLNLSGVGFLEYENYPTNFAYTYRQKGKRLRQDPLFYIENFGAAGSMYATATDLLLLDQSLYTDELLNAESRQLLGISYPEYQYVGYGVWNYNYPFVESQPTIMERRGGILGANVVLVRLTDDNYTIIILSNDDRFNPDSFGDENNLREMLIRGLY